MPPAFVYIHLLILYVAVACVVWIVAAVLAIPHRTRMLAKKIAVGMAGSFPGVFIFQLLSAPLLALVLLIVGVLSRLFRTPDVLIIVFALCILSVPAVASLLGFYAGWRVAWELAAGRSAREFLAKDRAVGPLLRFLRRGLPFLGRVL